MLAAVCLVAFAAQAAGLGEVLHLAVEHGNGCGHAHGDGHTGLTSGRVGHHGQGRADPISFRPASRPGHDFLHCPVCQALGLLKAVVSPLAGAPVAADSPIRALAVLESPALAKATLAGLGPRAPPAARPAPPSA